MYDCPVRSKYKRATRTLSQRYHNFFLIVSLGNATIATSYRGFIAVELSSLPVNGWGVNKSPMARPAIATRSINTVMADVYFVRSKRLGATTIIIYYL